MGGHMTPISTTYFDPSYLGIYRPSTHQVGRYQIDAPFSSTHRMAAIKLELMLGDVRH